MDKGIKKNSYVVLIIILLFALVLMAILLINYDESSRAKPLTTTTEEVDLTTSREVVDAKDFKASLKTILSNRTLTGDYEETIYFSGVKFSFNCTKYNKQTLMCDEGSALMDIGTSLIPLYTFDNTEENYYNRQTDLFIMLVDKNVFLAYGNPNIKDSITKIYDLDGELVTQIDNIIMTYNLDNRVITEMYPSITDGSYYYYTCIDSKVGVAGYDFMSSEELGVSEIIEKATCGKE